MVIVTTDCEAVDLRVEVVLVGVQAQQLRIGLAQDPLVKRGRRGVVMWEVCAILRVLWVLLVGAHWQALFGGEGLSKLKILLVAESEPT